MKAEKFAELLENPDYIKEVSLSEIQDLYFKYPQSPHVCLLVYLFNEKSNEKIKNCISLSDLSLRMGSRKKLITYLYKDLKLSNQAETIIETPNEETEKTIEIATSPVLETKKQDLQEQDHKTMQDKIEDNKQKLLEIIQQRLKEIQEEQTTQKPTSTVPGATSSIEDKKQIIQNFIENEPKITKPKIENLSNDDELEDLSEPHTEIPLDVATETLAELYEKQGKFDEAIKIYEKLMFTNSEKSSYFANKIENLKNKKI